MSSEPAPPDRKQPAAAGYFAILAAAVVLTLALIAGINFLMDPYAVWRTELPTVNQYRKWLHTDDAPIVTALFHRPRGLILGNSQVAMGFDPHGRAVAAWGDALPLPHETPTYDFETQVLEAASRGGRLQFAVVQIDERQLRACRWTQPPVDPLAAAARLLSLSVLRQSAQVLKISLGADVRGPPRTEYQLASGLVVRRVQPVTVAVLQQLDYPGRAFGQLDEACADQADRRLQALASLARQRRFVLVFFLPPWQQAMLQQTLADGDWPRLEELKRRLAGVAGRTGAPVWDFSTASLRPASGVSDRDYYDSFHFKPPLGERILAAMRPGAPDQSPLAIRLTPADVDAVVAADRQAIARLGPGPFASRAPPSADLRASRDLAPVAGIEPATF